jgi:hypothetical protein
MAKTYTRSYADQRKRFDQDERARKFVPAGLPGGTEAEGGVDPSAGGRRMTWEDIVERPGMTFAEADARARRDGFQIREDSWSDIIKEGLAGPLLLPAMFAGGMALQGVGVPDPSLAGGGEVGSGYASSAPGGSFPSGSFNVAQAPTGTMTDVSSGLGRMPAAVPETPATLRGWGLEQSAPGVWVNPSAPATAPTTGATPQGGSGGSGSGTPTGTEKPTPQPVKGSSIGDKFKDYAGVASGVGTAAGLLSGGTEAPDLSGALAESEEERQARIDAATAAVNQAFGSFDDNYYVSIADAYKNYQRPLFDEQAGEARRKLPMSVPNTASSAYQRKLGDLETDIMRGESDLNRSAIEESNRRRGEVDYERSSLINMATGGATAETVANEAATRAQQLSQPPSFSPLADMFAKYTADAANYALAGAGREKTAPQITRPLNFNHSPSSSVRTIG